jgi:delta(3,5)-delta(2,4)-dienoyl-CoA isomerase
LYTGQYKAFAANFGEDSLPLAIAKVDGNSDMRIIIMTGSGAHFCAGIDLSTLSQIAGGGGRRNQTKKKSDLSFTTR